MNRKRSPHQGEKPPLRHSCFHFINPNCFSRIPNNVIIELLLSLPLPWPDGAVRLYFYACAGFGHRLLPLRDAKGQFCRIELQKGEFICSAECLASLSSRSRNTITRILGETSVKVRRTTGNRNVYRSVKYQPEQLPPEKVSRRNSSTIAQESQPSRPPLSAAIPPNPEQHIKIRERERDKHSLRAMKNHHAAHDEKEKRGRGATPFKIMLASKYRQSVPKADPEARVSRASALQTLSSLRDKIPGDHLHHLLRRYGISPEELDAVTRQSVLNL